ncbi:hypothetical protein CVV43_01595 [Candidatus Saccharibacteria bacterium HGW-Saccharibacteria-1]|nr:MAG: hypothetical protein CVV43_01595 [Candidatus Saccharibacteria bacterium HGW-Saccharibacteria-1]
MASVIASSKTWGGTSTDEGTSITQSSDGGYAIMGSTHSFGVGLLDVFISKYSTDGILSWSRAFGGANFDYGNAITQISDGGYIITGRTNSFGSGDYDMFIAKYSNEGNLSWSKTWGGTGYDDGTSIIQSSDGGYTVAGTTTSFGAGSNDMFISKYSADGNLLWNKTWGGASYENGKAITQTSDGGYVVTGSTYSFGSGHYDMAIAKYSIDGNLLWNKTWGSNGEESARSIAQTSDGGYVVAGYTYSFGAGDSDIFIAKYSAEGNLSWNKTWGGLGFDSLGAIIQTNDGYAITGLTSSFGAGNRDVFTVKYSTDSNLSWNKTWGGSSNDYGEAIIQSGDGGYIVTGGTGSFGAGSSDMFMAKYSAGGTMTGCPSSICQSPTATTTSPTATITIPTATTTSPTATITIPTATTTNIDLTDSETLITPAIPAPPMTLTFSSQELYVAYPGINQTVCKEWTVPNGKQIKGFKLSQATESGYDYFTVSLDGVEKYKKSGTTTDRYVDTSSTPGTTIKACMSADDSYQEGYGGEVTGVVYN